MTTRQAPAGAVARPAARLQAVPIALPRLALGLAGLVAVSILLRSQAIHARFWIDEGLSVGIASHDLVDIPGLLRQDGSPPLYYLLLSLWMPIFGSGEGDTHLLSLAFAVVIVPIAFLLAGALWDRRAAWIAAVMAALNPYLTYYAQETRMYTLVALLSLVAVAAFAQVFAQGRRAWLPVFAIALALLLYTHNWGLFLAAGTLVALGGLWHGAPDRRGLARDAALAYGTVGLAYLPWVPSLLFQARHTGAPWAEPPLLAGLWGGMGSVLGGPAPAMAFALVLVLGLVTMVASSGVGRGLTSQVRSALTSRARSALTPQAGTAASAQAGAALSPRPGAVPAPQARAALAVLVTVLSALALAWLASQVSPAWANRYFAVFVGPLVLLGAVSFARAGWLGLVTLALLALLWLDPREAELQGKSNAHTMAVLVRDRLESGDLVVSTHPEQVPLLHYYLPGGLRFASSMGPVADPRVVDWRDVEKRLTAARPTPTADALVSRLRPGQHLLLVQPLIRSYRWRAPWTALVRRRVHQWERVLERDERLVRTLVAPRFGLGPVPRGVRAVLYEVVPPAR